MKNTLRASATILLAALFLVPLSASAQQPSMDHRGLGVGTCATMSMLLEKTIFNVDVMRLKIEFDKTTAAKFKRFAQGKRYSAAIEKKVSNIAYQVENAYVSSHFERDISLEDFVDAVRTSLSHAQKAGMIRRASQRKVSKKLPIWFGFLKKRGIKQGDRVLYRVRPNSLRTVYMSVDGKKLLDQVDRGKDPRLALLSGYFAPRADFREGLARSVCK